MDLEGHYSPQDMMETLDTALSDPLFPDNARFLLDVRESAELAHRPADQIRTIAEYFAVHAARVGNCCAILTNSPVQYGLGRAAGTMIVDRKVFMSIDAALAWLGVKPEDKQASE